MSSEKMYLFWFSARLYLFEICRKWWCLSVLRKRKDALVGGSNYSKRISTFLWCQKGTILVNVEMVKHQHQTCLHFLWSEHTHILSLLKIIHATFSHQNISSQFIFH